MLEPLHWCPGRPESLVLALCLRVGRNPKRGPVHSERIWFGSFHRLDTDILRLQAWKGKEFVRSIESLRSPAALLNLGGKDSERLPKGCGEGARGLVASDAHDRFFTAGG